MAAEAIQKDEILGRLEKEVSSMKAEVESAEEQRRAEREEAGNRERQIREEAEAKVAELKKLFAAANRCGYSKGCPRVQKVVNTVAPQITQWFSAVIKCCAQVQNWFPRI